MSITFEATYENGVLRPLTPVPFKENEKVTVVVKPEPSLADRTAGMIGWKGTAEQFEQIFMEASQHEQLP